MDKLKYKIHHYFLPHESNNYRARTLHRSYLIFYLVLLILLQTAFPYIRRFQGNVLGYATDITIEKILDLINNERKKYNLSPLSPSAQLNTAATAKASDMFDKNYWAHISPTGTTPWQFISHTGYRYIYAGENLAKSFDKSDEVVEAWMRSPSHRANILKPEYSEIGLAVMNGKLNGEETTLVVEQFGTQIKPESQKSSIPEVKPLASETSEKVMQPAKFEFPIRINKTVSLVLTEFLLIVLFIDSIFIWKHKTFRIAGHSLAHILFLLALLGAMGATGFGMIL